MVKDVTRDIVASISREAGYDLNAPVIPVGTHVDISFMIGGEISWDNASGVIREVRPGEFSETSYVIDLDNDAGECEVNHFTCRRSEK